MRIYRLRGCRRRGYRLSAFEEARAIEETRGVAEADRAYVSAHLDRREHVATRVRALVHEGKLADAAVVASAAHTRAPDDPVLARLAASLADLRARDGSKK